MDLREWFIQQDRPKADDLTSLKKSVYHYPYSVFRCETVMKAFLAGMQFGFMLTDDLGQPTETLRVMVAAMGAEVKWAYDLPPEERRYFAGLKKRDEPDIHDHRYYIRNISARLQNFSGLGWGPRWAHYMFYWKGKQYLQVKTLTESVVCGYRNRAKRFLALCPPNWELGDDVYEGLWHWHGDNAIRRVFDSYGYLEAHGDKLAGKAVTASR